MGFLGEFWNLVIREHSYWNISKIRQVQVHKIIHPHF
jgi:hypothetical protein